MANQGISRSAQDIPSGALSCRHACDMGMSEKGGAPEPQTLWLGVRHPNPKP